MEGEGAGGGWLPLLCLMMEVMELRFVMGGSWELVVMVDGLPSSISRGERLYRLRSKQRDEFG
jgi:hypothetical protein